MAQASAAKRRFRIGKIMDSKIIFQSIIDHGCKCEGEAGWENLRMNRAGETESKNTGEIAPLVVSAHRVIFNYRRGIFRFNNTRIG
jgi:hypothetical protein